MIQNINSPVYTDVVQKTTLRQSANSRRTGMVSDTFVKRKGIEELRYFIKDREQITGKRTPYNYSPAPNAFPYRFSETGIRNHTQTNEIELLEKEYEQNPQFVMAIVSDRQNGEYRFTTDDVFTLIDLHKENPSGVEELFFNTYLDDNGEKTYKLEPQEIIDMAKAMSINNNLARKLFSPYYNQSSFEHKLKHSPHEILNLVQKAEISPKFMEYLMNQNIVVDSKEGMKVVGAYNAVDIGLFLEAYQTNPEITKYLVDKKLPADKGYQAKFRFNGFDAVNLANVTKSNPQLAKTIIDADTMHITEYEKSYGIDKTKKQPRYNAVEALKVFQYGKSIPDVATRVISMQVKTKEGIMLPKFDADPFCMPAEQAITVLQLYKQDPELVEKYLTAIESNKLPQETTKSELKEIQEAQKDSIKRVQLIEKFSAETQTEGEKQETQNIIKKVFNFIKRVFGK